MSDEQALFHRIGSLMLDDRYIDQQERIHHDRDLIRRTADTGARRHGQDGPAGRRAARGPGLPVRVGSRSANRRFDWEDRSTWAPALQGVRAVYIPNPDLIIPGAPEAVRALAELAMDQGVSRFVMLTGRDEDEAQRSERELQATGAEVTIVRCAWFMQAFSEDFLLDPVRAGEVVLPAGDDQLEPFVDADDIADVAVAALTEPGHAGQVYELTGPRLLSFPQAVAEIAKASGRDIDYVSVAVEDYAAGAAEQGIPAEIVAFLTYLFGEVLGHSARDRRRPARPRPPTPGLQRLRRPQRRHRRLEPSHRPMTDRRRPHPGGRAGPVRPPSTRRRAFRARALCDRPCGDNGGCCRTRPSPVPAQTHPGRPDEEHPMTEDLITAATVAAAVGSALVAGLMFAFSTSVMPALRRRPDAEGIAVMQTINSVILNPLFGLVFGGTTVLCLVLAITAPFTTDVSHATLRGIGSALYVVGTFGVTMVANVPMNNALDAVEPGSDEGATYWRTYLRQWTAWNHLRALLGTAAAVLLILAVR